MKISLSLISSFEIRIINVATTRDYAGVTDTPLMISLTNVYRMYHELLKLIFIGEYSNFGLVCILTNSVTAPPKGEKRAHSQKR